jgi:catechol O-methyltransferase
MPRAPFLIFALVSAAAFSLLLASEAPMLPRWSLWAMAGVATLMAVHELLGRPVLFLRWSFLSMLIGMPKVLREWQAGDGREEDCAQYVLGRAPAGNAAAAIAAIDEYAYRHKFLMNVGDEKGVILERALSRVAPKRVLELGCYVGYSALRMAAQLPAGGHVYSVEWSAANAAIARRIVAHAGMSDRITIVNGSLGDGGKTLAALQKEHGFLPGSLDFAFIDHAKDMYLPDLERILEAGWLHPGSVVVADNVGFPGAPEYRTYMQAQEGKRWHTQTHETRVEYQSVVKDLVLESELLS